VPPVRLIYSYLKQRCHLEYDSLEAFRVESTVVHVFDSLLGLSAALGVRSIPTHSSAVYVDQG
jgi:hypothetical protein